MKVREKEFSAKNGEKIIVRCAEERDAKALLDTLSIIFKEAESELTLYSEERKKMSVEGEEKYIESVNRSEREKGDIAGTAGVKCLGDYIKLKHRGEVSISIRKDFQNNGVGYALMSHLIENAREIGYEQLELEVVSTNIPAIKLYEKLGFIKCGTAKHGFKNKDGYCDLDKMILFLN